MKTNYHTHTVRCGHAEGSDEDYVLKAIDAGFSELGFSDHGPWPAHPLERQWIRMRMEEFDDYLHSIQQLKRQYAARLNVKIGLEYEYYEGRLEHLIAMKQHPEVDYLIFGHHFNEYESRVRYYGSSQYDQSRLLGDYEAGALRALRSGLFSIFAHPDLFVKGLHQWSPEAEDTSLRLLMEAKAQKIPVEYNLGGVRNRNGRRLMYPYEPFWKLAAQVGVDVVIGVDAHSPLDLIDATAYTNAIAHLQALGIEPILDHQI